VKGKKTACELFSHLREGDPGLSEIKGLVYRENGDVKVNRPRQWLTSAELDELPLPLYRDYYRSGPKAGMVSGNLPLAGKDSVYVMITGRGCPYKCAFCMQVLGHQVRRRSSEGIVDEMEQAAGRYGAHTIYFADEIFLFNDEHTMRTMELIRRKGLHRRLRWRCCTRVNIINEKLLAAARGSGCYSLELGIESGNDAILKEIGKNITVAQIRNAIQMIKKAGIRTEANYIIGHPGETESTIRQTISLAANLNTDTAAIGLITPYPGTRIFEMALKGEGGYRLLDKNWSSFDKYGGRSMELDRIPLRKLRMYQRMGLVYFYVRNLRFIGLFRFISVNLRTILHLLCAR